jgi:hypothetical protein
MVWLTHLITTLVCLSVCLHGHWECDVGMSDVDPAKVFDWTSIKLVCASHASTKHEEKRFDPFFNVLCNYDQLRTMELLS